MRESGPWRETVRWVRCETRSKPYLTARINSALFLRCECAHPRLSALIPLVRACLEPASTCGPVSSSLQEQHTEARCGGRTRRSTQPALCRPDRARPAGPTCLPLGCGPPKRVNVKCMKSSFKSSFLLHLLSYFHMHSGDSNIKIYLVQTEVCGIKTLGNFFTHTHARRHPDTRAHTHTHTV
jgi:hypothetical protein